MSVVPSGPQIIWGPSCDANSVTLTAQVGSGYDILGVVLFTRLQSQGGDVTTAWNRGVSMHNDGLGTFTYDLSAVTFKYYQDFNMALVQYQLIATNIQLRQVARTLNLWNSLTLMRCPAIRGTLKTLVYYLVAESTIGKNTVR